MKHIARAILFALAAATAIATAQQIQIPVDSESRLERIGTDLEVSLKLFPEYPGFRDARLYLLRDSSYALDIEYTRNGRVERITRPMTREQMTAFRAQVTQRIISRAPQVVTEQEGRSKFIGTVATLSSVIYGPLLVDAFDIHPARRQWGVELLTAGGGFFAPYLLTRNARVTDGMATLALQGGVRGVVDGVFLATALGGDESSTYAKYALILSAGEMLAGYELARAYDISAGDAALVADLGNFGLGVGCLAAISADRGAFDGDDVTGELSGLAGTAVGYTVGALLANSSHYTAGDADMLSTAGVLGAGWPTALLIAGGADAADGRALGGALGAIAGLAAGHFLQEHRDFTQTQGTWIRLSTIAGGLIGLGIGAMVLANSNEGYRGLLLSTMIGGTAGFVFSLRALAPEAERAASASSWRVSFSPAGLVDLLRPSPTHPRSPLPLLGISASF